jgi:hypothetical protein
MFKRIIYRTQGQHDNHYTADVVSIPKKGGHGGLQAIFNFTTCTFVSSTPRHERGLNSQL